MIMAMAVPRQCRGSSLPLFLAAGDQAPASWRRRPRQRWILDDVKPLQSPVDMFHVTVVEHAAKGWGMPNSKLAMATFLLAAPTVLGHPRHNPPMD